jgi:hypothetical protein
VHRNHRKIGKKFSADLHPILFSKERVFRPLENHSYDVNYLVYGGDQPIFTRCFSPQNVCRTSANIGTVLVSKLSMVQAYSDPELQNMKASIRVQKKQALARVKVTLLYIERRGYRNEKNWEPV